MTYWTPEETRKLLEVAYRENQNHHLFILTAITFGLRVSEVCAITGTQIEDGQLSVQRLKRSNRTLQPVMVTTDPITDCSPLLERAKLNPGLLFPWSRRWADKFVKFYGEKAGIHKSKRHMHAAKHTTAMLLWGASQSLGEIQNFLGHKSASSSLQYLREIDMQKGIASRNKAMSQI